MAKTRNKDVVRRPELIADSIFVVRGHRVILDSELADLYGVATKRSNEQVKRNRNRSPEDFMLRLSGAEVELLNRSQFASRSLRTSRPAVSAICVHGTRRDHGSTCSQQPSRGRHEHLRGTYLRTTLRELLASNQELARRLDELERKLATHDQAITGILKAIRELTTPPTAKQRSIGFVELEEKK